MAIYIPGDLREQVRVDAGRYCGYCHSSEMLLGMPLEFEHIIGLTSCGRATVEILQMNNEFIVETRRFWVISGWHPPQL